MLSYVFSPSITSSKILSPVARPQSTFRWRCFLWGGGKGVGMRRRSCLRQCSTSRKIAGSISDGIIHCLHRSGPTMTVRSSPSVKETSIRDIPWGAKAAGTYAWQHCHLLLPIVYKFREPQPLGGLSFYILWHYLRTFIFEKFLWDLTFIQRCFWPTFQKTRLHIPDELNLSNLMFVWPCISDTIV